MFIGVESSAAKDSGQICFHRLNLKLIFDSSIIYTLWLYNSKNINKFIKRGFLGLINKVKI